MTPFSLFIGGKIMSKSALYTANTSAQNVAINGIINPGTIVRRFGQGVTLSGNAIQLCNSGYYDFAASITVSPTAAGNVTVSLLKDGVAVQGATATATAAAENDFVNLSIDCLIRQNCSCCEGLSNLTLVLSGTASSVTNVATVTEKI